MLALAFLAVLPFWPSLHFALPPSLWLSLSLSLSFSLSRSLSLSLSLSPSLSLSFFPLSLPLSPLHLPLPPPPLCPPSLHVDLPPFTLLPLPLLYSPSFHFVYCRARARCGRFPPCSDGYNYYPPFYPSLIVLLRGRAIRLADSSSLLHADHSPLCGFQTVVDAAMESPASAPSNAASTTAV